MKPAAFDYLTPETIDDAVAALAGADGDARVIAGGQSLVPMMNFRLVEADVLIDINGIPGLEGIEDDGAGGLHIRALTRHHTVETSELVASRFPVLAEAMKWVAHLAIRNRGTFGGSLAHADPAAELPALSRLLDAEIVVTGPSGERFISAHDLFEGALTTSLAPGEIVTSIHLPALPGNSGWGFEEFANRSGDFAIAGAAATLALENGEISDARIALFGVDETPVRASAAEAGLVAAAPSEENFAMAADSVRGTISPMTDLHGSADYRRHLAGVLVGRVLAAAAHRAGQGS